MISAIQLFLSLVFTAFRFSLFYLDYAFFLLFLFCFERQEMYCCFVCIAAINFQQWMRWEYQIASQAIASRPNSARRTGSILLLP